MNDHGGGYIGIDGRPARWPNSHIGQIRHTATAPCRAGWSWWIAVAEPPPTASSRRQTRRGGGVRFRRSPRPFASSREKEKVSPHHNRPKDTKPYQQPSDPTPHTYPVPLSAFPITTSSEFLPLVHCLRSRHPRRRRRPLSGGRRTRRPTEMMAGRTHHHQNNHRFRRLILRVVLLVFAVYTVSFALYLLLQSHHPSPNPKPQAQAGGQVQAPSSQKPWPRLPSFLTWTPDPALPAHSCEAYFGNGFSRRVDVLPEGHGGGGWFRCHHSETLGSSICEGARVRLDPALIAMSRGGEPIEQVMGRAEEEELPKYEPGAMQVEGVAAGRTGPLVEAGFLDSYVPTGGIGMHTMRALLDSARFVPPGELHCTQWVEEPTLLVTRFEYANLFHTITDWYSAYVSSRVTNLPNRPNVVFVDGHCKAPLEQTWEALFSSVTYAKNFSGPVCFRRAILSPLGYETALFKGLSERFSCEGASAQSLREKPDHQKTARLSEFGEMIVAAFDLLEDDIMSSKKSNGINVLFVRREDYLAHPRHSGKVESRLSNEREVFDAIDNWAKGQKCKINVVNGLFAHMNMKEQLLAIQEASVVIGAHGAGLTHLVSATPDTKVLEIISSLYRRPHFELISHWKGLEYHAINLPGSYARTTDVISELSNILKGLGC